jgi:hypothetical protein
MEFKNFGSHCKIIELLDPDAEHNSTIRNVGKCLPLKPVLKSYKVRILEKVFTKAFCRDSIAVTSCSVPVLSKCHYCRKINCTASNVKLFFLAIQ